MVNLIAETVTVYREWLALNVYVALCYYNMDYHDVSLEILNNYLEVALWLLKHTIQIHFINLTA